MSVNLWVKTKKQCIFHACPSIQGLSKAPKAYAVTVTFCIFCGKMMGKGGK